MELGIPNAKLEIQFSCRKKLAPLSMQANGSLGPMNVLPGSDLLTQSAYFNTAAPMKVDSVQASMGRNCSTLPGEHFGIPRQDHCAGPFKMLTFGGDVFVSKFAFPNTRRFLLGFRGDSLSTPAFLLRLFIIVIIFPFSFHLQVLS